MTALVVGATGYLGRNLVSCLVSSGEPTIAVTRSADIRTASSGATAIVAPSSLAVADAIRSHRPDVVYHTATHYLRSHIPSDIPALIASNVELGTAVLDASADTDALVVTTSSFFQYRESQPAPISLYAATKQAFTTIADYYAASGLRVRDVIIYDTYGPGDERDKLVPLLVAHALDDRGPITLGSPEQLLQLVYIDDVVAGLRAAAHDAAPSRTSITLDEPVRVDAIVAAIEHTTGRRLEVQWTPGAVPNTRTIDAGAWQRPPQWHPAVSLGDGISETVRASAAWTSGR